MDIKINDTIWHPCSVDIIEHKVTCIRNYEGFTHYVLRSVHPVGACGRIEVIISENKGRLVFVELLDEDNMAYASGLQDFVEGKYYHIREEAELAFYEMQRILCWSNMENKKRLYEESKKNYDKVELLVKALRSKIKVMKTPPELTPEKDVQ